MTETCRKTFKYQLDPTPEQAAKLDWTLWRCRELYNAALQERKEAWQKRGISIGYYHQQNDLPAIKELRPEYRDIHTHVLQDVVRRLDKAMQAFFQRVKHGEKPGYPRFQGRTRYHSFTYGEYGNGAVLDGGLLFLSKIGRVRIRLHRSIEGKPKTVTISREADGWYACISCADVPTQPLPLTGQETGIDVGLKPFLTLADGSQIANPRHYRKAEKALRKAERRKDRRKRGSKRRRKAVALLRKKHQKIARQRRDFHHKTALALVRQYDAIYFEEVQVANLMKAPEPKPDPEKPGQYLPNGAAAKSGLNKSIQDASWYQFRSILTSKAVWAGKRTVAVPPAYTSQDCSGCGERVQKSLSVRTHVCPSCGLVLDRDENAAINILRAGQARQGAGTLVPAMN
ncbi:MAG TPA: transposase [Ktedonobacterales bacterium]|nr:transposase [Ktedonobacterales bacterium]